MTIQFCTVLRDATSLRRLLLNRDLNKIFTIARREYMRFKINCLSFVILRYNPFMTKYYVHRVFSQNTNLPRWT